MVDSFKSLVFLVFLVFWYFGILVFWYFGIPVPPPERILLPIRGHRKLAESHSVLLLSGFGLLSPVSESMGPVGGYWDKSWDRTFGVTGIRVEIGDWDRRLEALG